MRGQVTTHQPDDWTKTERTTTQRRSGSVVDVSRMNDNFRIPLHAICTPKGEAFTQPDRDPIPEGPGVSGLQNIFGETDMPKTTPMVYTTSNCCAFNGCNTTPRPISRIDAARALQHIRLSARYGNARLQRLCTGKYQLSALNTMVLTTR